MNTKHTPGKIKVERMVFEFLLPDGRTLYSAVWFPKGSDGYSGYAAKENEINRRFKVNIMRGGGSYRATYYTDHNANASNSKEFVEQYLKTEAAIQKATE